MLSKFRRALTLVVPLTAALAILPIPEASAMTLSGAPATLKSAVGSPVENVAYVRHHAHYRWRHVVRHHWRRYHHFSYGFLPGVTVRPAPAYYGCGWYGNLCDDYPYDYGYYGYGVPYYGGGFVGGGHFGGGFGHVGGGFWRRR